MQKNSQDFSMQELMRLARSDAGQQLLSIVSQMDDTQRSKAMSQAASGDLAAAQETLSQLLSSPQVQQLLKQLEGN